MELKALYEEIGGSYNDVKSRLMKDETIEKFVLMFLDDNSFENLEVAYNNKNYADAFRAVHTLKGLSKNFSFDRLSEATEMLTETLRKWETVPVDEALFEEQWKLVSKYYHEVVDAIGKYR